MLKRQCAGNGVEQCVALLVEDDERAYFLKSQAQRKQKFLKRGKNVRGRDKVRYL